MPDPSARDYIQIDPRRPFNSEQPHTSSRGRVIQEITAESTLNFVVLIARTPSTDRNPEPRSALAIRKFMAAWLFAHKAIEEMI